MASEQDTHSPQPADLAIVGGRLLDPTSSGGVLDHHAVVVADTRIVDVCPADGLAGRWSPARTIDAAGSTVAPGFVDAHVHLGAFLTAAADYAPRTCPSLFSGGSDVEAIVPMVAQMTSMPVPAEITAAVLRPVFGAMLRSGITSVVDAGSPGLDGLVTAAVESGIRAAIGPSLADRWHDESGRLDTRADASELLDAARTWVTAHDGSGDGRVRAVVSGVETIACSDELLAGIADLAAGHDIPIHLHSHISAASDDAHMEAYGRTATERLLDVGFLAPRCTLMHVGAAASDDIEAFRSTELTVNHNALGNAMLGFATSGNRAVPAMLDAEVPIVLGSDYAPSMVATPFDMMRATLAMHREELGSDFALTLEQVLPMASNAGASVGRPGELGRLAPGQLADIVLVDTSGAHHLGDRHPAPSLALRARAGDVRTVIVNGRIVVDDGALTTFDEEAALTEARATLAFLKDHVPAPA